MGEYFWFCNLPVSTKNRTINAPSGILLHARSTHLPERLEHPVIKYLYHGNLLPNADPAFLYRYEDQPDKSNTIQLIPTGSSEFFLPFQIPHSLFLLISHHHRPALISSPGRIALVHGKQPMLGKPLS